MSEPLGFEREVRQIVKDTNGHCLSPIRSCACLYTVALALEAAFSKGKEYKLSYWQNRMDKSFSDGWNACKAEAAKIASWKCGPAVADHIRRLKPSEGESR